jgi:hypothetical protein
MIAYSVARPDEKLLAYAKQVIVRTGFCPPVMPYKYGVTVKTKAVSLAGRRLSYF